MKQQNNTNKRTPKQILNEWAQNSDNKLRNKIKFTYKCYNSKTHPMYKYEDNYHLHIDISKLIYSEFQNIGACEILKYIMEFVEVMKKKYDDITPRDSVFNLSGLVGLMFSDKLTHFYGKNKYNDWVRVRNINDLEKLNK